MKWVRVFLKKMHFVIVNAKRQSDNYLALLRAVERHKMSALSQPNSGAEQFL